MSDRVSVVVPTLGRRPLADLAVRSALAQRDVEVEVLLVADGNAEVVEALAAGLGDPRVRVLATAGGEGPGRARNVGLAAATAGWVAFLDDDDLWAPGKLRAQVDAARAGGARWAYTPAVDIDGAGQVIGIQAPGAAVGLEQLRRFNAIPAGSSNLLADTALLRELGGFDASLPFLADWDVAIRLSAAAPGVQADGWLTAYRRHASNMHQDGVRGFMAEVDRLEAKHAALGVRPDRMLILRWLAGGQRRAGRRRAALDLYLRSFLHHRSAGDLARAAGVVLGEGLTALVADGSGARARPAPEPAWLAAYRLADAVTA